MIGIIESLVSVSGECAKLWKKKVSPVDMTWLMITTLGGEMGQLNTYFHKFTIVI